jgi:hypothetical protein
MKFTKDDKMKYLVVECSNGAFYGFNLVVKNEMLAATKIVADVENDFTICGWRMLKKNHHGLYRIRNGKAISFLVKLIMMVSLKLLLLVTKNLSLKKKHPTCLVKKNEESMKTSDKDNSEASAFNDMKAGANNVCDWGQVIHCNHTELPPLKCQKDGYNHLVHHLCQGNWEQSNGHSNTIAHYCFSHHPNNTNN